MKVLMSIKPKYAYAIFRGEKRFEYRRKIWKDDEVDIVVVYATIPFCKVIGEFKVSSIMATDPETLWTFTGDGGRICLQEFMNYFSGCDKAHAISITDAKLYEERKPLSDYGITRPPQNFMYLRDLT